MDPDNKSDKLYTCSWEDRRRVCGPISKELSRYMDIDPNNYFYKCYPRFEDRRSGLNRRYDKPPELDGYANNRPYFFEFS